MGETTWQIKLIVARGTSLVIRDFRSSDPYVIVKLGNQTAKTKVISCCLNPVWNEEFSFSFSDPAEVLKLEVYDKDLFKADDKMGHAQLSLQPLVAAARLRQILRLTTNAAAASATTTAAAATTTTTTIDGMTLRKVIPEDDNCLAAESTINCVNGDIVQNVWLRLRDVESGDIELTLKLISLPSVLPSK